MIVVGATVSRHERLWKHCQSSEHVTPVSSDVFEQSVHLITRPHMLSMKRNYSGLRHSISL